MDDSTYKQVEKLLKVPQRRYKRLSQPKFEPIFS